MTKKANVCIIGSINMDLVTATDNVPVQGETLLGDSFFTTPGGKGANQAIAAARIGGNVQMIGAVGNDDFGQTVINNLKENGVDTSGVITVKNQPTGIANIILSANDNRIIVVQGANNQLNEAVINQYQDKIIKSDIVLLQLEIPLQAIEKVIELAYAHDIPVILNPAPYQALSDNIYQKVTYFTPNETELSQMRENQAPEAFQNKLIVTLGNEGVLVQTEEKVTIESYKVDVVDTTGAGDTFNGVLAAKLAEGLNVVEAAEYANAAAAISVTKLGAQNGMPNQATVDKFLK